MTGPESMTGPVAFPVPQPRRRRPLITAVIAVLCALLGFALVVQARSFARDSLSSTRPDDLVLILDGLQRREDELNAQIAELSDSLARLRRSGASSAEALAEAQRQAEALGILTGSVAATGPGLRIEIRDPDGTVPPEVLLDALQELRNAGAEAFQVGYVRVGVNSAFTGSGGAVVLDQSTLKAPYVILAIGDPPTLAAALSIPGGVLDTVRRAKGEMDIRQADEIHVEALRAARTPQYARPAG